MILIVGLTLFSFGLGIGVDCHQRLTAEKYIALLDGVRTAVMENRMDDALTEQAYIHALWQHEAKWLNCLISHHHTRAVNSALLHMATALQMNWQPDALIALDDAFDALNEISCGEFAHWQNVL